MLRMCLFISALSNVCMPTLDVLAQRSSRAVAGKSLGVVLEDGDRVVFLGNTLFERAQKYGHLETRLIAKHAGKNIIFRNLGWSGDTVWTESRGIFDEPKKGYERMLAHVKRLKPTVIFVGYGGNKAFAGKPMLPKFIAQYNTLLEAKDHRVRAAATRVIGHWYDHIPAVLDLLDRRVHDSHPRMRLEAVRVLGGLSDPRAILAALP